MLGAGGGKCADWRHEPWNSWSGWRVWASRVLEPQGFGLWRQAVGGHEPAQQGILSQRVRSKHANTSSGQLTFGSGEGKEEMDP